IIEGSTYGYRLDEEREGEISEDHKNKNTPRRNTIEIRVILSLGMISPTCPYVL
ncbi:19384_t:CDS:1, partial [Rhizophagus irregularis]